MENLDKEIFNQKNLPEGSYKNAHGYIITPEDEEKAEPTLLMTAGETEAHNKDNEGLEWYQK